MFDSITVGGIVTQATTFLAAVYPVILIVLGLILLLKLSNWVIAKFRRS